MMLRTRGNKAKRDKSGILADTKNLLYILHPALQKMPKIERIEGAPREMKLACYSIISHFSIAKDCPEVRMEHIRQMIGEFGRLLAAFELSINYGFFTDAERLKIARQLERIEEGVMKWRNATKPHKSQVRQQVADGTQPTEETADSYEK